MGVENKGCKYCNEWISEIGCGELATLEDCTSLFAPKFSYFRVESLSCPKCGQLWISGYYEDFTGADVTSEWGKRVWKSIPISAEDYDDLNKRSSKESIDLDKYVDEINKKNNLVDFTEIDISCVQKAAKKLYQEINRDFDGFAGIEYVIKSLCDISKSAEDDVKSYRKYDFFKWILCLAAFTALFFIGSFVFNFVSSKDVAGSVSDLIQGVEALIQSLIWVSAALWFSLQLISVFSARSVSPKLDKLSNIAHVIEMYQFNKDPEDYICKEKKDFRSGSIKNQREYTAYLGYCSKAVVLVSKIAAYYAQNLKDERLSEKAQGVQILCSSMSSKFWQKIMAMDIILNVYASTPEDKAAFCKKTGD